MDVLFGIPILGFVLAFPYYNERYLTYPERDALDVVRDVIDDHAREDATRAALFLDDLRRLDLARVWGIEQRRRVLHLMDVVAAHGRHQFDALASALTEDRERFAFLADE